MSGMEKFLKPLAQTKPARKRKGVLQKEPSNPTIMAIFIFLVLVLVLASIATFTGGVLLASTSIKASCVLLTTFLGTLRMEYSIIKILLGYESEMEEVPYKAP
jgi:hypothetical protein